MDHNIIKKTIENKKKDLVMAKVCLFMIILFSICLVPEGLFASGCKSTSMATGERFLDVENFRVTPINKFSARISGKIRTARYEIAYDHRSEQWRHRAGCSGSQCAYLSCDFRGRSLKWEEYMPSTVEIKNPFGPDTTCDVLQAGDFSCVIKSEEIDEGTKEKKYYFDDSSLILPKGYSFWSGDREIILIAASPDKFSVRPYSRQTVKGWYIDASTKTMGKIGKFIKKVTVNVYEKNTRLPVTSKWTTPESVEFLTVTITGLNVPSKEDIRTDLLRKFDGYITDKAMTHFQDGDILWEGEVLKKYDGSFSFLAIEGATYKIETRHPRFYYFSGILTPDNTLETKRAILLIETGSKVRGDDEGHGGEMIRED
ncbi:MAG: hypothetical protein V3W31_03885 [Thermodesulfobacteriota bacterium]